MYKKNDRFLNVKVTMQCSICLDDNNESMQMLECGHTFHKSCCDKWLAKKPACPLCRRGVKTHEPSAMTRNQFYQLVSKAKNGDNDAFDILNIHFSAQMMLLMFEPSFLTLQTANGNPIRRYDTLQHMQHDFAMLTKEL